MDGVAFSSSTIKHHSDWRQVLTCIPLAHTGNGVKNACLDVVNVVPLPLPEIPASLLVRQSLESVLVVFQGQLLHNSFWHIFSAVTACALLSS